MQEDDIILCPKCHVGRPRYLKDCPHCKRMFGTGYKGNELSKSSTKPIRPKTNDINDRHLIIGYFVIFIIIFILIRVCFL